MPSIEPYSLGDFEIGAAGTQSGEVISGLGDATSITFSARFVPGTGGATAVGVVKTTFNQGASWVDIARFDFATSQAEKAYTLTAKAVESPYTAAALAAEGSVGGLLGDRFKAVVTSTGTYVGAILSLRAQAKK